MLKVHVVTLAFDSALGSFDDAAVQDFLSDKELLEVREHFFLHHQHPYLALTLL